MTIIILSLSQCEQLSVGPLESKMYVPTKLSYSELKELVAVKLESYTIHKILTYSTFYSMYRTLYLHADLTFKHKHKRKSCLLQVGNYALKVQCTLDLVTLLFSKKTVIDNG